MDFILHDGGFYEIARDMKCPQYILCKYIIYSLILQITHQMTEEASTVGILHS